MPWVKRRVDPNPMPYGSHPVAMTPPYWVEEWVGPTPEEEERFRRWAESRVEALRTAADSEDLAQVVEALSSAPRAWPPWESAVKDLWHSLMGRRQLGDATHDLLCVRVAAWPDRANSSLGGDYFTERWTEGERTPAWQAPGAGSYRVGDGEGSMDVWLTTEGQMWCPATPGSRDGGGFRVAGASRDIRGVLNNPNLVMAVPRGERLRVARAGFWHLRSLRVLNATTVVSERGILSTFSDSLNLGDAVLAACQRFRASSGG